MKKNLITGLVLAILSLICGLLLSLVNSLTSPLIEAKKNEEIKNSLYAVCPSFNEEQFEYEIYDNLEYVNSLYLIKNKETNSKEFAVYLVETQGFNGKILMMIGVSKDNKITGYKVIEENETKGDITKHDFNMINNSSLDSFDILSGSTVSSKAVRKTFDIALKRAVVDLGGNYE